jgi:signal transduction histidine kinase
LEQIFLSLSILFIPIAFYYKKLLTDEKKRNERLQQELTIAHEQQVFFIRKMIHEMNTPLSAIELNISPILKAHCCVHNVEMIKSSVRTLATIYEDIAFHVGKEKICYPSQWIDIEDFVADRMLYFDTMASVKNIFLEMQADASFYVFLSKTELQRIVDNTLSNAIKYSSGASPIIEIMITQTQDETLELTFKDTGIGMSEKEIENLFDSYFRGKNKAQGLGLGMSIIKEICDEHEIEIKIKSEKSKGSTFTYIFPKHLISKNAQGQLTP